MNIFVFGIIIGVKFDDCNVDGLVGFDELRFIDV